ncbi:carboxymuconolactone decarboxylase family protein [Campylobacter concisus]|jgi:4-carboxymuconolactone decarboxylase|uniref:carboxymuconolactone decarboxylase family protein n=1 Tax=Campylobacter concisus TaxID=199 RepID=UPI000A030357|nr:carboxymuconolactone decarboxylase family protein [Campylobacter concisus]ORI08772.1 carboxymuconolactone decarboxylase [Campylobacter concisus]
MKLTNNAKKIYETWFNSSCELESDSSDFLEDYLNFLGDIGDKINIDEQTRLLVIVASLCVSGGAKSSFKSFVRAALNVGISAGDIKEILYQAVPYAGLGRVEDQIFLAYEIFNDRCIKLENMPKKSREGRGERGLEIQRKLFPAVDKFIASTPNDQRHIMEFLSQNCFGDFYARGVLSLELRELLTFVYIVTLGFAKPQLLGHIAANFGIGNDRAKLISVVTTLIPFIGYPSALNALSAINEISSSKN